MKAPRCRAHPGASQGSGQNYREAGCASPRGLVRKAFASEDQQLLAVANEIIADGAAVHWPPTTGEHLLEFTMVQTTRKTTMTARSGHGTRNSTAALRRICGYGPASYLMYLGFEPSDIDGMFGKRTRSAMNGINRTTSFPLRTTSTTRRLRRSRLTGRPFRGVSWRRAGHRSTG